MVARRAGGDRRGASRPAPTRSSPELGRHPRRGSRARILDRAVAARRWDVYKRPVRGRRALRRLSRRDLRRTSCGPRPAPSVRRPGQSPMVRDFAWGAGLAAFLRAIPDLEARGRKPLARRPPRRDADARPRRPRPHLPRPPLPPRPAGAGPARRSMPGWQAGPVLRQAAADPVRVAEGSPRAVGILPPRPAARREPHRTLVAQVTCSRGRIASQISAAPASARKGIMKRLTRPRESRGRCRRSAPRPIARSGAR
jgi:hypothetical protein